MVLRAPVQERQAVDEACTKPRRIVRTNHVSSSCIGPQNSLPRSPFSTLICHKSPRARSVCGFPRDVPAPVGTQRQPPLARTQLLPHDRTTHSQQSAPTMRSSEGMGTVFPGYTDCTVGIPVVPLSQENRQFRIHNALLADMWAPCRCTR
jgi:hypothetical protein